MPDGWVGQGRVRAREASGLLVIAVDGLTTQAKYYKPLIYEFFRKEWRGARPAWGDYAVEILMEYTGDPPWLDLDNLAKALLDAIKGYAFHDDAQVSRLLVERRPGERERIVVRITPHAPEPLPEPNDRAYPRDEGMAQADQGARAPQTPNRTA